MESRPWHKKTNFQEARVSSAECLRAHSKGPNGQQNQISNHTSGIRSVIQSTLKVVVILSVCFCVMLSPAIADEPSPAPEGSFSFVVLPDTQAYCTQKTSFYFEAEINWILEHRHTQNIVFVSHVGDIVGDYESDAEWDVARRNILRLSGTLPFGLSVGNHDMLSSGESTKFQEAFPASLFKDRDWYGGQIRNNANSYQLISAVGRRFLILHLECNAPDDVLTWASDVLERHSDRLAMITTHMYLGPRDQPRKPRDYFDAPKGRMEWHKTHGESGNTPQQMWEKCFSRYRNVFLICCGDQSRTQAIHRTVKGRHGNPVHECLSDYRGGYLRIYRFEPSEQRIRVMTYSPYQQKLCDGTDIVPDVSRHQFTLGYGIRR